MEDLAEKVFRVAGHAKRVPVVLDPAAASSCAYASKAGTQDYIGIFKACLGPLRNGNEYNWFAVGVICHEVGHLIHRHVDNDTNSHAEETAADEWSGWAMFHLGATLDEALTTPSRMAVNASTTHPGRSARLASVTRGFQRAEGRGPQFESRFWWAELMAAKLPWVR